MIGIDNWANFLVNEKLDPRKMDDDSSMELAYLCEILSENSKPIRKPYKKRIETRRLIVETALDLGIDLIAFKNKRTGKILIGRGLLNIWKIAYELKYGSAQGTKGEWEIKRRDIKTKLSKEEPK